MIDHLAPETPISLALFFISITTLGLPHGHRDRFTVIFIFVHLKSLP